MTHLKKQEQLDDNIFVPANLEENNLTSDDIDQNDDVNFEQPFNKLIPFSVIPVGIDSFIIFRIFYYRFLIIIIIL